MLDTLSLHHVSEVRVTHVKTKLGECVDVEFIGADGTITAHVWSDGRAAPAIRVDGARAEEAA